jgi:hypothetical protein
MVAVDHGARGSATTVGAGVSAVAIQGARRARGRRARRRRSGRMGMGGGEEAERGCLRVSKVAE